MGTRTFAEISGKFLWYGQTAAKKSLRSSAGVVISGLSYQLCEYAKGDGGDRADSREKNSDYI